MSRCTLFSFWSVFSIGFFVLRFLMRHISYLSKLIIIFIPRESIMKDCIISNIPLSERSYTFMKGHYDPIYMYHMWNEINWIRISDSPLLLLLLLSYYFCYFTIYKMHENIFLFVKKNVYGPKILSPGLAVLAI